MIKFLFNKEGRKILGIILSDGNVDKLKEKQPIHFNAEQMNLKNFEDITDIVIFHWPTEQEAIKWMKDNGYIDKHTIQHIDELGKSKH